MSEYRCDVCGQKECRGGSIGVERDQLKALYDQAMKTNKLQAHHGIEQRKEIEILKSANDFLSDCLRNRQIDVDVLKARVKRLEKALEWIANGKAHIGNDWTGNVFGPPDAVMCRNAAKEALKADTGAGNPSSETWSAGSGKEPPPPR